MSMESLDRRPGAGSDHGSMPQVAPAHTRRMSKMAEMGSVSMSTRRMSVHRRASVSGSMLSHRTGTDHAAIPLTRYQNTYRLGPDAEDKFNASKVERVIVSVLESYLRNETYEASKCKHMIPTLTDMIKNRVRELGFRRYKLACYVILGEMKDQCFNYSSRCVWNADTDNFAQGSYSNKSLFAVASVYGCYYD